MGLNEVREQFLSFFAEKEHLRMPSFPLVPVNDNSLLLINAGMAPLKKYFTGEITPPKSRVTTCQKCIRTPDIERVGITARHGTFFEMLGNFSFGDYFKEEAILFAWEFITKRLKLSADKLFVSVYLDDDEAAEIWVKKAGVSPDRIVRLGKEDNFWEIGVGPCGPCSEIYYDRGEENGCGSPDCAVGCDCDRFVEFWNLVFTQFDKDKDGNYNKLAKPNIDTGMGLERIAAIMQGVSSLFEVDTIKRTLDEVCKISNKRYGKSKETDISIRVVTDHIRSTVFLVSDGVIPSNEGRGYVLRRLLRRAARHGKLLGIKGMFLTSLADIVISQSKDAYPELSEKQDYIKKNISAEEKKFYETIDAGMIMLNDYIAEMKKENKTILDGGVAFKLYDTYGFPLDLTKEIIIEHNISLDEEKYNQAMERQREQARNARGDTSGLGWENEIGNLLKNVANSEFIGYDNFECDAEITAIIKDSQFSNSLSEGESGIIITDKTVFYGESGGQAGDSGVISAKNGECVVNDTTKYPNSQIGHNVTVKSGIIEVNDRVKLAIDCDKRMSVSRNHSATHLLHKALKTVLGEHVNQAGSYVTDERLRFDFSHFEAVKPNELKEIERLVNAAILRAMPIKCEYKSIDEAKKTGATALFSEKYGDTVRVVSVKENKYDGLKGENSPLGFVGEDEMPTGMGDYSAELCGGTHLTNTAQAGLFKILSENGVAAGVRRIEGVTGAGFLDFVNNQETVLLESAETLKINNINEFKAKLCGFANELKESKQEIEAMRQKLSQGAASELISDIREINGIKLIVADKGNITIDEMKMLADQIKEKFTDSPVLTVLAGISDQKITFLASANKAAVEKGVHCGKIIKEITLFAGGTGGGKPDMAQGGGKEESKIAEALAQAERLIHNS